MPEHSSLTSSIASQLERLNEQVNLLTDLTKERWQTSKPKPLWSEHIAWQWQADDGGYLQPIVQPQSNKLSDLLGIDRQKAAMRQNTAQFVAGLPANNVLLWGARGTGKSSLIKALLQEFSPQGLRVIEVDKDDLGKLPVITDLLRERPEYFVLYCDDLSFSEHETSYKALKAALDGSLAAAPENVLIYATSNRRHLLPEYQADNQASQIVDGELHHGEAVEEKISLSERFGLWLSFQPFSQTEYLAVVAHWLAELGSLALSDARQEEALRFALLRGSRSGRVAWQYARDQVGKQLLVDSSL